MVDWQSKRVIIIGAARQGLALARYLSSQGADVVLTDLRGPGELVEARSSLSDCGVEWCLGGHPFDLLDGCDLICPSGGVPLTIPLVAEAQTRGILLSNDSQIFLEAAPCLVIGITGSAGKTTTTTLVARMIEAWIGKERTWVGGNIGSPLISKLEKMGANHIAVMELSSFQLEIMTSSPQISAILNLTPNHLDRHLTMESYTNAKANILNYQNSDGVAVLGRDDPGAWSLHDAVRGGLVTFGFDQPPGSQPGVYLNSDTIAYWDGNSSIKLCQRDLIQLRGDHNLANVIAACALAVAVEIPSKAMQAGVEGFTGVEHRLEFVKTWGGADWYNDSIATAPERSMAAIRSFDQPLVLLAGGRDKDLPWGAFAELVQEHVDHLIIFGEAREIILRAIKPRNPGQRPFTIESCESLIEAVDKASRVIESGDVVLLSPGGTSFDEFKDFADRGESFRKWVKKLP
jgi:UDP-N-acetylmuramoylalanine--D-glutamate ligase